MTDQNSFEVTVKFVKATKNKYRFQEIEPKGAFMPLNEAIIGTVYVPKSCFKEQPELLKISVRVEK